MDYNDNDYEGQNLHLAGEESSKISVLRPFALPKFDFDDSLHGHLRFDSLVENEVFLGIPSQEDNHWIEDFSRGGNGIEFSSSAAESCALPRHINVWSEATSSESVEMLLKAVGQEEMVPGENIIQESDPGDQLGSSTRQMENNLAEDDKVDDVDNPSILPAEVGGSFSSSNRIAVVENVQAEHIVQVKETTSYDASVDNKESSLTMTTGNSNLSMKIANDNQGESCGLVDESLSVQLQENLPGLGEEIDNTESASQKIDVCVREFVDKDKISDISFVNSSSSRIAKGISDTVEKQEEGCNEIDLRSSGTAVETDNVEMHRSHEIPSRLQSSIVEPAAESCITNFGEASSMLGMGESVSTSDGYNKIAYGLEPSEGLQHATTSDIETKQLPEGHSTLHENSAADLQGEDIKRFGIESSDVISSALHSDYETEPVRIIQSPDQHKSLVSNDDISPECNSSVGAPGAMSESMSIEAVGNFSEKDDDHAADDPVNLTGSPVSGECCDEKSVVDDMEDARCTAAVQTENVDNEDNAPPVSNPTCSGDMLVDAPQNKLDVSTHEIDGLKLSLDPCKIVYDDINKEISSTCPAGGATVETVTGFEDNSIGDHPVLSTDVKDTKLAASCVEGDGLVDSHEHNSPSHDSGYRDQNKETETDVPKQQSLSASKESFESDDPVPAIETEMARPDTAAGEIKSSQQSVSLLETSHVTMLNEVSNELTKRMEDSANALIVLEDDVEAAHTKKPMEVETERNHATSSALSEISCTVEIDKSKKEHVLGASCTDLSKSQVNNQAPLERNNGENNDKVLTSCEISGVNDPPKEEGAFSFDIRPLGGQSTEDAAKDLQSFRRLQASKLSSTVEGFTSVSGSSQMEPMIVKETSHVSSSNPGVCSPSGGPSERKSRRGGGSKSGKGSSKKGNLVKEISPLKQTEKGDKSSPLFSPSGTGQLMTFESGVKPRGTISIPTSSLPDLNTSAPSSTFFQQPFSDSQQVQLRAQIFVYGSLIQGAAPDESCMISAFDGGRSAWERSWRACVDRLQKSQGNITGTPVPPRSGAKAPDQTSRQGFPQNEVLSSPVGRASNKAIPSVVSPLIPLSSPLWSISTPSGEALPSSSIARGAVIDYQAVSPLNPYQTPPMRNYVAHTTWPSQAPPPPFPVPWLPSSQSSPFDISTSYPAFPITEPVKSIAGKESSLPIASVTKHAPPIPETHTGPTTMLPGASSVDSKKVKVPTSDTKTRKRKKSGSEDVAQISLTASLPESVTAHAVINQLSNKTPVVEDLSQISLIAQSQVGSMSTPVAGSYYSTSVAVTTPSSFVPKGSTSQPFSMVLPSISSSHLNKGDLSTDKRALKFEGFSKVEEAKLQAQEAAAHAAAAISHCEGVWSQLDQQKCSGMTSDAESKLASAAVAIAAAASVAKAAAAAAKIASNAAVQAKQMADEAFSGPGTLTSNVYDSNLVYNSTNLANASPVSMLKGGDRNNAPSLAISAAREAARKRIEAASAATRHAENLDAIVKAAELAAEAVAHAGKVVAMGDPFSLITLAEAGPNNYWKVPLGANLPGSKLNELKNKNKSFSNNAGEMPNVCNQHVGPDKDIHVTSHVMSPIRGELSRNVDDHVTLEENLPTSVKPGEHSSQPYNDKKMSDSDNAAFVVPGPDTESRPLFFTSSIKEGSHVEVLKDHGDLKKAWFSASVLSLKDGEALVCYSGLQSDEGSEQLKEWISLEAKDGDMPKVRLPHPMTGMQFEGTRKRRRGAVKDYTWSVGDRVDAWVHDCWCEGIVAEKNKKDTTTLSVHFPAQENTSNVKMWHLRPSLVWSDGQWIEWSRPGHDGTSQGETPVEKRPKLGSTSIVAKGKAKNIDFAETDRIEEPRLPLSANEKVFNIGSMREENKPNMVRTMRSGLEKEGSRVVFGVPKPGKKRKFMDVSKHYVSDRTTKTNVPSDSVKLAKFLTPQGSGSRGFKNSSKLDFKEKQVADSKSRTLKSGKPPSIPSRTLSRKDNSTSSRHNARDVSVSDHSTKGSISNDSNESSEHNPADVEEASHGTMVFSSQAPPQGNRKKAVRSTRSERLNQGKLAPAGGKLAKDEAADKLISEVAEPRRSNRRIQPTSRLLEGLQSSLIISKIPSSSDKGHRNVSKGTARGNNNRS